VFSIIFNLRSSQVLPVPSETIGSIRWCGTDTNLGLLAHLLLPIDKRESAALKNGDKPIANPYVVLREEFDDWAILFNCDTGRGFGLSPTGVYVWKLLDGEHTTNDLLKDILASAHEVPEAARDHVDEFIDELAAQGLVGFESIGSALPAGGKRAKSLPSPPPGPAGEPKTFTYEPPKLVDLYGGTQAVYGICGPGSHENGECFPNGNFAAECYDVGNSPTHPNCLSGTDDSYECNVGTCALARCNTGSSAENYCNAGSTGYPSC